MGALVQGKSPEEIATCLEKNFIDQHKMVAIGKYNGEFAKSNFMASIAAEKISTIYNKTLI
jgi:hypothetical protein